MLRPMENTFTGSRVDRMGTERKDAALLERLFRQPGTLLLPVTGDDHHVHGDGDATRVLLLPRVEAPALAAALDDGGVAVLLGRLDGVAVIAVEAEPSLLPPDRLVRRAGLRALAANLPVPEAALLAQARGYLHWRRAHRHCSRCGALTAPTEGGTVLHCIACDAHHFPRTDAAVIMLVRHRSRALLARATRFEHRMLSTLAGFVEPGESLEEAVRREVAEECGIAVDAVRYHSSQPWPFPASIMLGFNADAAHDRVRIDDDEISEAAFLDRRIVRDRAAHGFDIPPPLSIARRLIDDWMAEDA